MNDVESLIGELQATGCDLWTAGPQTEESIRELEVALATRLPPSYRSFVSRYGGLCIGDTCVSGILEQQAIGEGAGWIYNDTQRFREDYQMPNHLLVVQPDESAPYCLDTMAADSQGEYPVVCWEIHSGHVTRIAPSFAVWFADWLRSMKNE